MAFKLNGNPLAVDVPFTVGTGEDAINYPANWLRLSTAEEKTAIGITEVADDPVYDQRFYKTDGTAKEINDVTETIDGVEITTLGLKTLFKIQEKEIAKNLLNQHDWQVVRKAEKGIEMDSAIVTYRDGIRTACKTRQTEIDNCSDTAALVTLYGTTTDSENNFVKFNMTQYPVDPNSK